MPDKPQTKQCAATSAVVSTSASVMARRLSSVWPTALSKSSTMQ
jgi:hypothetical protein